MITVYPYESLGHANHGWLDARYHFSFSGYHNPDRVGFNALLVINDDTIAPHRGFGQHPHDNMEIITYVREGAITHKDSMGNAGRTAAGDVQVMSAGSGIAHSEFNAESVNTRLFQIWILPDKRNVPPRWETRKFPKEPVAEALHLLVSGKPEHAPQGVLFIHQNAAIYGGVLTKGTEMRHPIAHQAYALVSRGIVRLDGHVMRQGDGAEITATDAADICADTDAEILVIDVPPMLP